jgi:hypothetical protein
MFGTTSKHHIGGIMAGNYLTVDNEGKLDVDDSALLSFIKDDPTWK